MKPIFFDDKECAKYWLEDYKIRNLHTALKIRPLAYRFINETGRRTLGGFVISTRPQFEYIGKWEVAYAGPPEYENCLDNQINQI